jgi:hypothetical protein
MWHGRQTKKQIHTGFWWGDLREINHLEGLGVNGNIILSWILKNHLGRSVLHWPGSELGQMAGCCEGGDERSGFHNTWNNSCLHEELIFQDGLRSKYLVV